jgi:site-specific recombinase XerD
MLKEMKLKSKPDCNIVFQSQNNTYINPRNFERVFQTVVTNAGIEKCNSRTLRHTFATRCFEKGISVKIVSRWLGHSKIAHTLDIYVEVMNDVEKKAILTLESQTTTGSASNQYTTQFTTQ